MKYDFAFEKVAKDNNITKEQVIKEIEAAAEKAMKDPRYKEKWDKIKKGKKNVTADDIMEYFLSELNKKGLI